MQALSTERLDIEDGPGKETQNNGSENRVQMFGKCLMINNVTINNLED